MLSQPVNLPDFTNLDLDFKIVDCHHHLFDLDRLYYPWLTDQPEKNFLLGNYDALKQNYLPQDYQLDAATLNVVKTVHIEAEADHENSIAETRWISEIMRQHRLPNAIVAHSWLHRKDSAAELAAHAEFDAVRGIRSKPVTSTRASNQQGVVGVPASMQDPAWRQGLGRLRDYNFSWDLRVPYWHLHEAAQVCALYPDLPVVVEHTGLPWDRSEAGIAVWHRAMSEIAQMENVYVKISELGLAGDPWEYEQNRRVVLDTISLFGFDRCMFASNFPVSRLRIGFYPLVAAIAHMINDCSVDERNKLFYDTAVAFYRL